MQDEEYDNNNPQTMEETNSNKRKRSESPTGIEEKRRKLEPSKVLFLRQLAHGVTEQDILKAVPESEYGRPKIILMSSKHTALVEFDNIDLAKKFLDNSEGGVNIKDRDSIITWSERKELDTRAQDAEEPCNILHCTVVNARKPVYVNSLERIFGQYGVEKIKTFTTRSGVQQALIQFRDIDSASAAKTAAEGAQIFNNCFIHLRYSKNSEVVVKYNDSQSRDYTNNNLPPKHQGYGMPYSQGYDAGYGAYPYEQYSEYDAGYSTYGSYPQQMYGGPQFGYDNRSFNGKVLLVNNVSPKTTCDELFILFGVWGDVEAVKMLGKKPAAFVEFTTPQFADTAYQHTKQIPIPLHGEELVVQRSKYPSIKPPRQEDDQNYKQYKNHVQHRFRGKKKMQKSVAPPSTFLHFANLHGDVTEEELRGYVEPFGTVKNINLFGKKDCTTIDGEPTTKQMAIVEFESLQGAVRVLVNRHVGDELRGFKPRISFSNQRQD